MKDAGPKPRNAAERRAAWWYRLRGYRVVGTNVWAAGYEIDVIASRGRTLVFCEVKSKAGTAYGDPLAMITREKARRVRHAAETWLAWHPAYARFMVRYDAIVVRSGRLECLRGAF